MHGRYAMATATAGAMAAGMTVFSLSFLVCPPHETQLNTSIILTGGTVWDGGGIVPSFFTTAISAARARRLFILPELSMGVLFLMVINNNKQLCGGSPSHISFIIRYLLFRNK